MWPRAALQSRLARRTDSARRLGGGLRSLAVLALDRFIILLAMDGDRLRCVDAEANFIATNVYDGHDDIVADHDALVTVSRKDQHGALFLFLKCGPNG